VFYGSNLYQKDKPRWTISNATVTSKVPGAGIADRLRGACGSCVAWLIGLPRRAGARLHAANDAEARWWRWQVTERCGGLVRQYRDARFEALAPDTAVRRGESGADLAGTDFVPPDCPCTGDH
jgi:hypothetical protein